MQPPVTRQSRINVSLQSALNTAVLEWPLPQGIYSCHPAASTVSLIT